MTAAFEPAGIAYAAVMATIHTSAFPPAEAWGRDAIAAQLALPGVAGWVDPDGGMILARIAADEVEVLTLAVAPARRRRGIATALLNTVIAWGTARGAHAVFLEVAANNIAAQALYQRAGFSPVGQRTRYYSDGTDAVILQCPLNRADANATS